MFERELSRIKTEFHQRNLIPGIELRLVENRTNLLDVVSTINSGTNALAPLLENKFMLAAAHDLGGQVMRGLSLVFKKPPVIKGDYYSGDLILVSIVGGPSTYLTIHHRGWPLRFPMYRISNLDSGISQAIQSPGRYESSPHGEVWSYL